MSVATLNAHPEFYSPRLQENLRDIPYTIFEHLLADEILRYKQKEAINCTAHKMFDEHKRALALIMPTGTGKTVIMARMLAGLKLDEAIGHKAKKILIVTDSEEGVKNTVAKLKEFAGIDAGVYYGKEKDIDDKQVIVTIYNSWQDPDFPIDPESIDLTILDEGHKGLSEARQETLEKHENSIFLALTASPTYTMTESPDYDEERNLLERFDLAYEMTVPEAVEHGLICSIRNLVLKSDADLDLEELAKFNENFDKALEREIKKEAANRELIKYLVHGLHPDTKQPVHEIRGIGSCYDTEHAEFIANELNKEYNKSFPDKPFKHGFARFIAGDTPNRDEIIKQHRAGEIQYLIYADLLNQNYDDKKIGVVANFRLTDSLVIGIQRGGRATRWDEEDPGKIALIIDVFHKFKGKFKRQPMYYAHAIGSATLITKEAARLAVEKSLGFGGASPTRLKEAKEEARAMQFDTVTEQEAILGLFNDYLFDQDLPEKTKQDLTQGDLVKAGIPQSTVRKGLQNLEQAQLVYEDKKAKGVPDAENPEPPVKVYKVKPALGAPALAIYNDPAVVEAFKVYAYGDVYGVPEITEQDLTSTDLFERLDICQSSITKILQGLYQSRILYKDKKAKGVPEADNPEPPVKVYKVKFSKGVPVLAIHNDPATIEAFKVYAYGDTYGVPEKTEQDLTHSDLVKVGIPAGLVRKGWQNLDQVWILYEDKKAKGVPTAENPEPPVKVYTVKTTTGLASAIHNNPVSIEVFKKYALGDAYGVPEKTEQDLTYGELVKANISSNRVINGLRNLNQAQLLYEDKKIKGVPEADNPEPPVKVYTVKSATGLALAIRNDLETIEAFKRYALSDAYGVPEKTEEDLTHIDLVKNGIAKDRVTNGLKNLEQAWILYEAKKAKGVPAAENPEPSVKVYKVKNSNGKAVLAINNDPDIVETFKKHALGDAYDVPEKTERDLTSTDLAKKGMTSKNAAKGLQDLDHAWVIYEDNKAKGVPEADNPKPPIKVYKVNSFTVTLAICNDLETIEAFKRYALGDAYGLPEKTEHDLTLGELKKIGFSESKARKGLQDLYQIRLVFEDNKAKGVPDTENPEPLVKVYKVKFSKGAPTLAINDDPITVETFKLFIDEKNNLLSPTDKKSLGKNPHPKPD